MDVSILIAGYAFPVAVVHRLCPAQVAREREAEEVVLHLISLALSRCSSSAEGQHSCAEHRCRHSMSSRIRSHYYVVAIARRCLASRDSPPSSSERCCSNSTTPTCATVSSSSRVRRNRRSSHAAVSPAAVRQAAHAICLPRRHHRGVYFVGVSTRCSLSSWQDRAGKAPRPAMRDPARRSRLPSCFSHARSQLAWMPEAAASVPA
mmetsp:Transcript_5207/g.13438  ORF Transcript_5207/g.13438 Transcript_5207/m.13438 type:complete len:206 (-) Transcript_5207:114-731(-)